MFPESFAEHWIERLSEAGDVVLDPFCGRGTTPFQALLMGRSALACDVNPVAYCITKAKTTAPSRARVKARLTLLERGFDDAVWERERQKLPLFFHRCYHPSTLREILYLRDTLSWKDSPVDCMIAALTLGSLHGESHRSPRYLSNRMPRTISTKPSYSIRFWDKRGLEPPRRDAFALLRGQLDFRYASDPPKGKVSVHHADMRDLPTLLEEDGPIRCVITSPPYFNVTSFEEDQWLRLWFLGGAPRPTYGRVSRDDRIELAPRYWDLISDIWRMLGRVLGQEAHIVFRLGGKKLNPARIAGQLHGTSVFSRRKVHLIEESSSRAGRRQTQAFLPDSSFKGSFTEVDAHFVMQ